jgi:drug/metabolite transporter (DMT)-like permease
MLLMQQKSLGIIQVILSGICFGFLGYFGKIAFLNSIKPGELLALRYSMAGLILFIFLLFKDKNSLKLNLKDTCISILLGVFGYALFSSLFFYALTGLSASLTVLLLYTYPIMVTILSRLFLKEEITKLKFISLVLASIGMYLLVAFEWKISGLQYFLSGIGAAFFYSLYIIYSRKYLERVSPLTSSLYVQIGAGTILSLLNFQNIDRPLFILQQHFLFILTMSIVCSVMAMTLFLAGLQKITSMETSILSTTEPISGIIIAILFLGEKMNLTQIFGAIFILTGLILIGLSHHYKKEVEPNEH